MSLLKMQSSTFSLGLFLLLVWTAPALLVSGVGCPPTQGPATTTPEGWVHIALAGTDSWLGAYHDGESGALLYYDFGIKAGSYVGSYSESAGSRETGEIGGVPYEMIRVENARQRELEVLRREIGPQFPDLEEPYEEAMLPPEGSSEIVVTIKSEKTPGNFRALVCSKTETDRVQAFIHGQAAYRWLEPARPEERPARDFEALAIGEALQAVISKWKEPVAVFRSDCRTLVLLYGVRVEGEDRLCRLEFGAAQDLTKKVCLQH